MPPACTINHGLFSLTNSESELEKKNGVITQMFEKEVRADLSLDDQTLQPQGPLVIDEDTNRK